MTANPEDIQISGATPTLEKMNPNDVEWQMVCIDLLRGGLDYSLGVHEILLSGSIGSAKSLLMAHIAITHCMMYSDANVLIGRNAIRLRVRYTPSEVAENCSTSFCDANTSQNIE